MSDDPLQTPVQFVKGVGPQRAVLLNRLEIETAEDLLWYLPRDVLDLTGVATAAELKEGEPCTVRGSVVDLDGRNLSGGRTMSAVLIDSGGGFVRGTWFNQPWVLKKFRPDQVVLFSGKPKRRGGRWEFSHPRTQWIEDDDPDARGEVLPRYGLTEGLKMYHIRRCTRNAVEEYAHLIPEHLPQPFRDELELPRLSTAIRGVHVPATMAEYEAARRRLILDDLLEFQAALALRRRAWKKRKPAPKLPATGKIDARIRRLFPFKLTDGQDKAIKAIAADLKSGAAMHRLLQADVGAGKTAVAMYAMLTTVAGGYQTVLMAPTEVLARQHWRTLDRALANSRVERLLLTGSLTAKQRREALEQIERGDVQLVVGTQAVIQKDVAFQKLGLAVIDEQHKFGVVQRAHFSMDDDWSPHVLVMTATPIPRSLCLTQFGDLDVTTIKDLPPGRQKVVTSRVPPGDLRRQAWDFIRKQLKGGRQAYVICPRIGGDDGGERRAESGEPRLDGGGRRAKVDAAAEKVFRDLSAGELRDFRVGLVHGQLDRNAKSDAMESFNDGETQVLVATTVVEVGVDVPNATLMVVLEAERFGLSQLHQLRGRISRGKFQGYCFLMSNSDSDDAIRRLHALETTSDGFKIAEVDFDLRGPGDILGTRQHGDLPLRVADLTRDADVLKEARKLAFDLIESSRVDEPEFAPFKIRVLDRFGQLMDLPQTG